MVTPLRVLCPSVQGSRSKCSLSKRPSVSVRRRLNPGNEEVICALQTNGGSPEVFFSHNLEGRTLLLTFHAGASTHCYPRDDKRQRKGCFFPRALLSKNRAAPTCPLLPRVCLVTFLRRGIRWNLKFSSRITAPSWNSVEHPSGILVPSPCFQTFFSY